MCGTRALLPASLRSRAQPACRTPVPIRCSYLQPCNACPWPPALLCSWPAHRNRGAPLRAARRCAGPARPPAADHARGACCGGTCGVRAPRGGVRTTGAVRPACRHPTHLRDSRCKQVGANLARRMGSSLAPPPCLPRRRASAAAAEPTPVPAPLRGRALHVATGSMPELYRKHQFGWKNKRGGATQGNRGGAAPSGRNVLQLVCSWCEAGHSSVAAKGSVGVGMGFPG